LRLRQPSVLALQLLVGCLQLFHTTERLPQLRIRYLQSRLASANLIYSVREALLDLGQRALCLVGASLHRRLLLGEGSTSLFSFGLEGLQAAVQTLDLRELAGGRSISSVDDSSACNMHVVRKSLTSLYASDILDVCRQGVLAIHEEGDIPVPGFRSLRLRSSVQPDEELSPLRATLVVSFTPEASHALEHRTGEDAGERT
jgi:hypothetical protein